LRATRHRAGAVLISIGRLLMSAEGGGRRATASVRGTDAGC
jgi:hypothetical protein